MMTVQKGGLAVTYIPPFLRVLCHLQIAMFQLNTAPPPPLSAFRFKALWTRMHREEEERQRVFLNSQAGAW